MKERIVAFGRAFLNLVYPLSCCTCGRKMTINKGLCEECVSKIHKNEHGMAACRYEGVLKEADVPVPNHRPNLIATYTALAPVIREDAGNRLSTFRDDFGPVAAAREFEINRRTVRSWIDHPERIPIEKAVIINNKISGSGVIVGRGVRSYQG